MPKQLQVLATCNTMLQATALRVQGFAERLSFGRPLVVAGEDHRFHIAEQLMQIELEPKAIILEPQGRNTAPAVALAAHWFVASGNPDALMLIMPSDHLIGNETAFRTAIAEAAPSALEGRLVTFGINPDEPATGYGYIEAERTEGRVRPVSRFVEKPDLETAERYLAEGLLWNAGIFLMKASVFLKELTQHAPLVAEAMAAASTASSVEGLFCRPGSKAFERSPSISIDYAVMERSQRVSVIPVDMGWSDVGSWDALWRVTTPDSDGNVVRGAGMLLDCKGSLVRNEGGPFVAALGLEDMVVVATGDAILIAPRNRAEEIRAVVDRIEADGLELARTSQEVRRPWGSYCGLMKGENWQVKRIRVKPGGRLSLQKHAHRAESWIVASGTAIVTVDSKVMSLSVGQSVAIPLGAVHRLENPGPQLLELIEVQTGDYLGEDDIVRLEDIYGRAG